MLSFICMQLAKYWNILSFCAYLIFCTFCSPVVQMVASSCNFTSLFYLTLAFMLGTLHVTIVGYCIETILYNCNAIALRNKVQ